MKYKLHLFLLLFTLLGSISLQGQAVPKSGDLAHGGIVVDYNPTTKLVLVMSLDEATDIAWLDAKLWANTYIGGNYIDWELPSIDELKLIHSRKDILNSKLTDKLSSGKYYSISPAYTNEWCFNFENGGVLLLNVAIEYSARTVRTFNYEANYSNLTSFDITNSANSTIVNSIIYGNMNGDGQSASLINLKGNIMHSAISQSMPGINMRTVTKNDFRNFDEGEYKLANTSKLIKVGSVEYIDNSYKHALNSVERTHKSTTDMGAYQTPFLYIKGTLIPEKVYDGATDVKLDVSQLELEGLLADFSDVTINLSQVIATFDTKDVGENKQVTITGSFKVTGADIDEYILVQPSFTDMKGTITKAPLTVKAADVSFAAGTDLSTINTTYTIEGFVNGENKTQLDEQPNSKLHSDITISSPVGTYPDKVIVEGGTAKNYTFRYTLGTVTITDGPGIGDDYITFEQISNKKYGDVPFTLTASHGLSKEIYFKTSDASTVSIVKVNNIWTASINKPGTVTITAVFDGDAEAGTESKPQTINIAKADLIITADDVTRNFGEANPIVTNKFTVAEWVNDSDKNLFTTNPKVEVNSQYTISTVAGIYQDGVLASEAVHPYYNITFADGMLTIIAAEVPQLKLFINGYHHPIEERYIVKRDYTATTVTLEVETGSNTTIVNSLPSTANVEKPSIQDIKFNTTNIDGSNKKDYSFEIEKRFSFDELIIMRWNNVLTVINRPEISGFEYLAYQWYKNGEAIRGANRQSYSATKEGQGLNANDKYHVEVTILDNGTQRILRCWEEKVELKNQSIVAYPIPVKQQNIITIEANIDENLLQGANVHIFNSIGNKISQQTITGRVTQITAPAAAGFYIMRMIGNEGFIKDFKIVVQ